LTCSQSRAHFLRQANGSAQWAQILVGSSDFLRIFMEGLYAPLAQGDALLRWFRARTVIKRCVINLLNPSGRVVIRVLATHKELVFQLLVG
jgi:hypothetical protein